MREESAVKVPELHSWDQPKHTFASRCSGLAVPRSPWGAEQQCRGVLLYLVSRPSPDTCVPRGMGMGQIPICCVRSPMLQRELLHPRSASLASWLLGLAEELTSLAPCSFGCAYTKMLTLSTSKRRPPDIWKDPSGIFFFPGDFSTYVGFQKGFHKGNETAQLEDATPSLLLSMWHYRETLSVREQLGQELPVPGTLALCCWDG